ncbi:hypothetical protein J5X84_42130 [Streptosporangiaceae bacterium NEAU-GS5]|nr:hypothetical protein [Streptosporangiaceae bacterium NEAU-GS5]
MAKLATALEGAAFRTKMLPALRITVGGSPEGLVEGERRSYPPRLLVWNHDGHELATVMVGGRSGCFLIARPDGGSEMASDAAMAAALVAGHLADGLPITGVRDE